jgi:hypothetical protein
MRAAMDYYANPRGATALLEKLALPSRSSSRACTALRTAETGQRRSARSRKSSPSDLTVFTFGSASTNLGLTGRQ